MLYGNDVVSFINHRLIIQQLLRSCLCILGHILKKVPKIKYLC
jgi:hypothetical protein